MSLPSPPQNRVRSRRLAKEWTQAELADRAGVSRAAVSAVEIDRLVPSVAAALAIARALDCSVEELFGDGSEPSAWAWPAAPGESRYWQARVGPRTLVYPVEGTSLGVIEHDGVIRDGEMLNRDRPTPDATLVMATCDPAASLLATEIGRASRVRLLPLSRSSRAALDLLRRGLVHVAGIHLATAHSPDGNRQAVKDLLGPGYRLLRVARWEEGLTVGVGVQGRSVRSVVNSQVRWVGRESGSAARECQDELRPGRPPRHTARDHRGVAEAIRCGWADAGVCLRFVAADAGLGFLPVREEAYDLCFPAESESDPRIQALIHAVQSVRYRRVLGELPGISAVNAGEVSSV